MLSDGCARFRKRYRSGATDGADEHLRSCVSCATWTERLEKELRPPLPVAMPSGLQRRLSAIAHHPPGCEELDRVFVEHGAPLGGVADEASPSRRERMAEHLRDCGRCRSLYGVLEVSRAQGRRPLPPALRSRLQRRLAPESRVPAWIRDTRYGAAACYGLTFFLLFLAGDSQARFRTTLDLVSSQASQLLREGEAQGRSTWDGVRAWTDKSLDVGRSQVVPWREQVQSSWRKTTRTIEDLDPDRFRSRLWPKRGDGDDQRDNNERNPESDD